MCESFPLPPILKDDPKAIELHQAVLKAKLEYFRYIEKPLVGRYIDETKGLVCHFPDYMTRKPVISKAMDEDTKSKIRDLYLSVHPDKNQSSWAVAMFLHIDRCVKENEKDEIDRCYDHLKTHDTLETYSLAGSDNESLESIVDRYHRFLWFQWFQNDWIKRFFKTEEEMKEITRNLEQQCKNLQRENEIIKSWLNEQKE
jgi:F0F1-type ATP synthase gamma subunit